MFGLGGPELVVLMVLGVLLFGKNLPAVGRSLGKGLIEFKRGLSGLEDQVSSLGRIEVASPAPVVRHQAPKRIAATAPKFAEPSNSQPMV